MPFEELDHFVISQLQLGNTTSISYRNMPHAIHHEQCNINALVACTCAYPNRGGSDDFGGASEEEHWGHARIVSKDRTNERILWISLA